MIARLKNKALQEYQAHKKLITDSALMVGLRGLQIVFSLITTYFLVRALSKDSFGEYHFILSCMGILTVFNLKDLDNSIMQAVSRGFSGTYRKAVPIALTGSFIGSLVLGGFALWHYNVDHMQMAYAFAAAACLFPFSHGLMQWKSIYTGKETFGVYFINNSLVVIITSLLTIALLFAFPGKLLVPVAVLLFVPAIQNIVFTVWNFYKIPADAPVEDGNIAYGIKTTFYSCFNILAMHADKLLLFYFLSPAALATFAAADRIADLFRNLSQDLGVVLAPKFAKHSHYSSKMDLYLKWFIFSYGAAIVIFSFTLLPYFMTILFGTEYTDSIPYAQALLCSVAIGNMATLKFRFIRSQVDTESFRRVTILTSLARIILSVILIPVLGLLGAVISAFLYRIFLTFIVNQTLEKKYYVDGKPLGAKIPHE